MDAFPESKTILSDSEVFLKMFLETKHKQRLDARLLTAAEIQKQVSNNQIKQLNQSSVTVRGSVITHRESRRVN